MINNFNVKREKSCCACGEQFLGQSNQTVCLVCVPRTKSDLARWQRYGLTKPRFEELVRGQGGICAICKKNEAKFVDHEHSLEFSHKDDRTLTKEQRVKFIRGILCLDCNTLLRALEDQMWYGAAMRYINNHRSRSNK